MENRYCERKSLSFKIELSAHELKTLGGKTLDISLGGLSVDLKGVVKLNIGELVEVVFPIKCGNETCEFKAKAEVVHLNGDRLGLKFQRIDSCVVQKLRRILFGYATLTQRAVLDQGFCKTNKRLAIGM